MKVAVSLAILALGIASCQKDLSKKDTVAAATVASDAQAPLRYHSIYFNSDYPVNPGEVPPFQFFKELYPDTRVRTIRMIGRAYPIYPGLPKHAVQLTGTFTYAPSAESDKQAYPGLAFLKGTSEVWEYYVKPSGEALRRLISSRAINYKFKITPEGYCRSVTDLNTYDWVILEIDYKADNPNVISHLYTNIPGPDGNTVTHYFPTLDQYGNITSFVVTKPDGMPLVNPWYPAIRYDQAPSYFRASYDYSIPRGSKNYSFIPSQNLISQEYSLLEVMQWLPQSTHQRKAVGGTFTVNGKTINQDQVVKNYLFDANGNEISVTYGDNVHQKTTWVGN